MLKAALLVAALAALAGAQASAQESGDGPTAEEMIETAREAYRPPGLRARCAPSSNPDEIVVCAPDSDQYRVFESPTDEALRTGKPGRDTIPRAPDVNGLAPCEPVCIPVGAKPPQVHLIDLSKIPVPLTEEEARHVYRAEDGVPADIPPQPVP